MRSALQFAKIALSAVPGTSGCLDSTASKGREEAIYDVKPPLEGRGQAEANESPAARRGLCRPVEPASAAPLAPRWLGGGPGRVWTLILHSIRKQQGFGFRVLMGNRPRARQSEAERAVHLPLGGGVPCVRGLRTRRLPP